MATVVNFPPEIIQEILQLLPAKSLGRFKCVSKRWNTLISTPEFIKTHLNHNNHHLEKLLLLSENQSLYSVDLVNESSLGNNAISAKEATELRFSPPLSTLGGVYCSCDGLVLVTYEGDDPYTLLLINPTTREWVKVPFPPPLSKPDFDFPGVYGLGYDSLKYDYKVVIITYFGGVEGFLLVNVYSLRSKSWGRFIKSAIDHAIGTQVQGVYLNGHIHWLCNRVSNWSSVIACFDLQNEELEEVGLPSFFNEENEYDYFFIDKLDVVNGCLCLVVSWSDILKEIWVMKEYGVIGSWKKISVYGLSMSEVKPLSLLGDQEVLLEVDRQKVVLYNVEEKTLGDAVVCGIPSRFSVGGTYVESLVSPKHGNGLQGAFEG